MTGRTLAGVVFSVFLATLLPARDLTIDERIQAQQAVEQVYYAHRIGASLPFETAVPRDLVEAKVRKYLKESAALDTIFETPITAEALERGLARMEERSSMPERLRELRSALGDDRFLLMECLVRPRLAERMARSAFDLARRAGIIDAATSWDSWWSEVEGSLDEASVAAVASEGVAVSAHADPAIETASEAPAVTLSPRSGAPAIWTGSEMILWGGQDGATYLDSGLRYDPATDTWTATSSTGAPSARRYHTAVWTGDEMIVWGGFDGTFLGDGARYDPASDTWTAVSDRAPLGRAYHSAVWTGTEMIVWGGARGTSTGTFFDTGARYDPAADRWTPVTLTGAPTRRARHTAVWTGTEMIVWGGHYRAHEHAGGTGGRYDPATDTWTATNVGPRTREDHTAVWTGSEMIAWGGNNNQRVLKYAAVYDPAADSWTTASGPHGARDHTAIWTGTQMLAWGGRSNRNGITYDPASGTIGILRGHGDRPDGTRGYSAVWTGDRMIVWGGGTSTGGVYDPAADTWVATSTEGP